MSAFRGTLAKQVSYPEFRTIPTDYRPWSLGNSGASDKEKITSRDVDRLTGGASVGQHRALLRDLISLVMESPNSNINLEREYAQIISKWYVEVVGREVEGPMPNRQPIVSQCPVEYQDILRLFAVESKGALRRAFVFPEGKSRVQLWGVHSGGDQMESLLVEAYGRVLDEFPDVDVTFRMFSEDRFEKIEIPDHAVEVSLG